MTFIFKKPKKHPVRKKKSQDSQEVLHRLNRYLSENGGEPAEFIARHWKDQATVFSYQEIRQAVLDGYIHEETMELWRQDYSKLVSEKMYPVWKDAIAAGSLGQPVIDRQAAGMVFNINEPSVISWLETRGAEFVTNSTETQRKAIQALLMKKIADEHTVDELAKMIRPCIGLTEAQAKANVRFYDNMVATLKEEHPRMSQEAVEKKAREAQLKYAEKQHRYRAHTIAQTEMAIAYNKGADEGIRQAQAQGLLGVMEKRWSTSGDDNVCDVCRALEGTQIAMDDEFDFKGRSLYPGSKRTPPAHPWCGCAVQYIEVEPPKWGVAADDVISQTMQGLAAGDGEEENTEHDPPKYLGALDNMSEDVVISTLEEYEKEIAGYDKESAIVITDTGLIFQCFGNRENVYVNEDMGDALKGAYVTHNHPVDSSNEYSFSSDDIQLFTECELKVLRGIDERYIYELTREINDMEGYATIEELMASVGELARHQAVIQLAQELGIGYARWKR